MKAQEIREKYQQFFEQNGHKRIPSASLIPQNDPTVLFTTAGMQQFKPYYTREADPQKDFGSKNTVTVQKCIRNSDIEEVGDDTHLTFFEMLGNFSFGGYWKDEAIRLGYEFITKELGLKIDYVSVFDGDDQTPADSESEKIWQQLDPSLTIKKHSRADNFWGPTGDEGPCGPTTEIYVNGVEIWNIVFNEYYKTKDGQYQPLETKGIDTGMGLERLLVQVQGKNNVYETDLFESLLHKVGSLTSVNDVKAQRIIADHFKAAMFLIADGEQPSNKVRGYVVRKLIRRALAYSKDKDFDSRKIREVANEVINIYSDQYPEINSEKVIDELSKESLKFRATIEKGLKLIEGKSALNGKEAFDLFQSYGFPLEVIREFVTVNELEFSEELKKHQDLSRTASAGMFKGGLASHSDKVVRLHTATHLMNAALRKVLGDHVFQKGSNITEERTRFDFTHNQKLTDDQKTLIENTVNDWILADLTVKKEIMPIDEARKLDAIGVFGEKYADTVSVYTILDPATQIVVSREFCGGPHVEHTKLIGKFKIQKEESVSAGVRRIKAVVE